MEKLISHLRQSIPGLELRLNENLSAHSSFQIGGTCAVMALPCNEDDLILLQSTLREHNEPPIIIGRGTNLLFAGELIKRVIIKLSDNFSEIVHKGEQRLFAKAGSSLASLAVSARDLGLSGLEFAHGIPGSVGGAVLMNAGAYGGEMKDVVRSVKVLCENGLLREICAPDCDFSYRHSVFCDSGMTILGCEMELSPGDPSDISAKMFDLAKRRRASQPINLPSAGSAFKRPAKGYAAALIDDCGLRGFRVGGAAVSEKHAGFIVNMGAATYSDVRELLSHVQLTVLQKTGIELEPEIRIISE